MDSPRWDLLLPRWTRRQPHGRQRRCIRACKRSIGTPRRIRVEDVRAYKAQIDQERDGVLDRLVEDAEDEDYGYQRP